VTEATGGDLTITITRPFLPPLLLQPPFADLANLVDDGTVKMAAAAPQLFRFGDTSKEPDYGALLLSGIPFGLDKVHYLSWYDQGGGREVIQSVIDNDSPGANTTYDVIGITGAEIPGWFREKIPNSPNAFDNKKIFYRINLDGAEVWRRAFPKHTVTDFSITTPPVDRLCTLVPPPEVGEPVDGFENGSPTLMVDRYFNEFNGPNGEKSIVECGFNHLYLRSFQQEFLIMGLIINKAWFEGLEPRFQSAIRTAAQASILDSLYDDINQSNRLMRNATEAGAIIHASMPSKIYDRLRSVTPGVLADKANGNAGYASILNSYLEYASSDRQPYLLYESVRKDRRYNLFPGEESDIPVKITNQDDGKCQ
jgi:TRAP-type mannitol/chloroaromatic compound transport system substrate-binding protein